MYKRISKKSFERQLAQKNKEKKLTKNQKEWEYQAYLLNNRLAAAEKRGFVFSGNEIPQRPQTVRAKDIQSLKNIRGDKKIFKISEYVEVSKATESTIKNVVATYKPVYGNLNNSSVIAPQGSEVLVVLEKNAEIEAQRLREEQIEIERRRQEETWRGLSNTVDYEDDEYDEDYEEYEQPDKAYYRRNQDRQYEEELDVSKGMSILSNVRNEISLQETKNSADDKLYGRNADIKQDAGYEAWRMVEGAISEYGETEVALRLQNASEDVNKLVEYILYAYYQHDPSRTETRTNARVNSLRDILFGDDVTAKMKYDFHDEEI